MALSAAVRQRVLALLREHEGLRLKPYRDTAGKLTIGYGRNLDDVGITEQEAELLLEHDLERVAQELDAALPWWRELDEPRQVVLLNMAFNLGVRGLCQFVRTLGFVQEGQYEQAAAAMLQSRWAQQVGRRAQQLAALMRQPAEV